VVGDKIRKYKYVNIGVAVAVDEGLLVPVIRNADQKTLSTISGEVKDLAGKAKDKKLQPKDWEGSTFSISNLGMFGIDEFTAIINPPDSCILAIGTIKQTVKFEGEVAAGVPVAKPTNVMKVTLSCDHRCSRWCHRCFFPCVQFCPKQSESGLQPDSERPCC
jgi:pyruvate dehydrogenase E2 component (dihydrolipoamide acetyltransferase)